MSVFGNIGVPIELNDPDDFLKVKETLTRLGVASNKKRCLYQSCHILHKQGQYAIVHFKELFILDGKQNTFGEEDLARRNTIANLLQDWELVNIIDPESCIEPQMPINMIKILAFKDKSSWTLVPKYNIGG
jgi:hypothetical protein